MSARGVACCVGVVVTALVASGGTALRASTGTPIRVVRGTQLTGAPWQQLASASSSRSRAAAFVRGFRATPTALAFTVAANPTQRVKVFWSVYCEGYANDEIFTPQGSFTVRAPLSAYPPVLADAAKCFVTVRATPTRAGRTRATVFGY